MCVFPPEREERKRESKSDFNAKTLCKVRVREDESKERIAKKAERANGEMDEHEGSGEVKDRDGGKGRCD